MKKRLSSNDFGHDGRINYRIRLPAEVVLSWPRRIPIISIMAPIARPII
jgi:hypothetical protein